MKAKTITLFLALGSLSGFAHPIADRAAELAAHEPQKPATAQCPDFSGSWQGTCVSNGQESKANVVIKQNGCNSIQTDSLDIAVDGLNNYVTSSNVNGKAVSTAFSVSSSWSDDHASLETHYSGMAKALDGSKAVPFSGTASTRLENGKLHSETSGPDMKIVCDYARQ